MTSQLSLLKTRRFLPLFITQLLGAYNDNVYKSALMVLITYHLAAMPERAQFLISLGGGIFILPFLLFSAFAGQLADKFNRSYLVRLIKLIEILLLTIGIFGFYLQNITLLMVALFLMGTHSTFFGPIKYSVLPNLLKPEELLGGNGIVESSTFLAILLGTIIGTLYGATPSGAILVTTVSLGLAVIAWISSLFFKTLPIAEPGLKINWNLPAEILSLTRYVKTKPIIYRTILEISWFWLIGFIFLTQFPVYAKSIIGADEQVVTLFLILFSVGIAAGSILCNRLLSAQIHTRFVPYVMLGMSLFTLDFCWASNSFPKAAMSLISLQHFSSQLRGWRIMIDLFLLACCGGIYLVPLYATLQKESPPSHCSRVISCNNIFNALFMVLGAILLMGLTTLGLTSLQIFLITGIVNGLVAFYVWKKQTRLLKI